MRQILLTRLFWIRLKTVLLSGWRCCIFWRGPMLERVSEKKERLVQYGTSSKEHTIKSPATSRQILRSRLPAHFLHSGNRLNGRIGKPMKNIELKSTDSHSGV